MKPFSKRRIGLFLLIAFFLAPIEGRFAVAEDDILKDPTKTFTKIGDPLPSFEASTVDGSAIKSSDLKGKVVVVHFWATWCLPCVVEMPRLENEIWRKFRGTNFVLLAIAREDERKEILQFRKQLRLTMPIINDPHRDIYKLFASEEIHVHI